MSIAVTTQVRAGPTVGVALPVPDPWGRVLREARLGYGEDRAAHIPTHVTLLPPTEVEVGKVDQFRGHLADVAAAHCPFEVVLRGTGTFRPVSQVVYVQVAQGVGPCEQLERSVRRGPVSPSVAFPYHPHVTVAHDLPEVVLDRAFAELADFTCRFIATQFRMYLHHGDQVWRSVAGYELTVDAAVTG